jgi:hypothetical protein
VAGQAPADRDLTEGTLAGLRFVRNQIGDEADLAEFVGATGPDPATDTSPAGNGNRCPNPN